MGMAVIINLTGSDVHDLSRHCRRLLRRRSGLALTCGDHTLFWNPYDFVWTFTGR
jgi:hypothetical protein